LRSRKGFLPATHIERRYEELITHPEQLVDSAGLGRRITFERAALARVDIETTPSDLDDLAARPSALR
jgi:hypothetical protein